MTQRAFRSKFIEQGLRFVIRIGIAIRLFHNPPITALDFCFGKQDVFLACQRKEQVSRFFPAARAAWPLTHRCTPF
jgi:hypothetical protein